MIHNMMIFHIAFIGSKSYRFATEDCIFHFTISIHRHSSFIIESSRLVIRFVFQSTVDYARSYDFLCCLLRFCRLLFFCMLSKLYVETVAEEILVDPTFNCAGLSYIFISAETAALTLYIRLPNCVYNLGNYKIKMTFQPMS